jgi:hypothetical protein
MEGCGLISNAPEYNLIADSCEDSNESSENAKNLLIS